MKRIAILLVLLGMLGMASCAKRYTCPTYLKDNTEDKDTRVDNTQEKTNKEEIKG